MIASVGRRSGGIGGIGGLRASAAVTSNFFFRNLCQVPASSSADFNSFPPSSVVKFLGGGFGFEEI